MRTLFFINSLLLLLAASANAQLIVNGTITVDAGATLSVQGNITTTGDMSGAGKMVIAGGNPQQINTGGSSLSNLEIAATADVTLAGNCRLTGNLNFVTGKIKAGAFNFILSNTATVTGAGPGSFIETNGTGEVRREVSTVGTYTLPVGVGTMYMPVQYEITGSSFTNAYVGTQLVQGAHPKKPLRSTDYITSYWKAAYSGVNGGTVNVTTTYVDGASVTGVETALSGLRWTGTDWVSSSNAVNTSFNTVKYNAVPSGAELYLMNKFVLAAGKVFLQGAYNSATGLMTDALRTAPCLIPTSDPYRSAPYSANFSHINNDDIEIVSSSVFADQAIPSDNIVDWVFLELRSATNQLIQTRSALLQRDGDIVDIDGISPVYFKNVADANYIITVRHRNHLGLGADAATFAKPLTVARPSTINSFDLSKATDAQLYGLANAYTTDAHPTLGTINMLWGGNANMNGVTKYSGLQNDKDYVLINVLNNNPTTIINNAYDPADVNMNRTVRFTGLSNDKDFLYITVLGSSTTVQRLQAVPN